MTRRTATGRALATRQNTAPQVIYLPHPLPPTAELIPAPSTTLTTRRRAQLVADARWAARQDERREHDRKVRSFLLGFGAALGVSLITGCAVGGVLLYRALAHIGTWATGHPLELLIGLAIGLMAAGVGGHRCITIVKHWH